MIAQNLLSAFRADRKKHKKMNTAKNIVTLAKLLIKNSQIAEKDLEKVLASNYSAEKDLERCGITVSEKRIAVVEAAKKSWGKLGLNNKQRVIKLIMILAKA
jgi:hypothetical protein